MLAIDPDWPVGDGDGPEQPATRISAARFAPYVDLARIAAWADARGVSVVVVPGTSTPASAIARSLGELGLAMDAK